MKRPICWRRSASPMTTNSRPPLKSSMTACWQRSAISSSYFAANEAAFRLVAGEQDKSFDRRAVERATERARFTTLNEDTVVFEGQLNGALRESRVFEYRTGTERGTITGQIDPEMPSEAIARINRELADQDSRGTCSSTWTCR